MNRFHAFDRNDPPSGRRKVSVFVACALGLLALVATAEAQNARSPDELAAQVRSAILSGKPDRIVMFFDSGSDAEAVQDLAERFHALSVSEEFNVTAVSKQDANWPARGYYTQPGLPGVLQRYPSLAFPVEPLGRISVAGKKSDETAGCKVSVLYGQFGQRYLMMLGHDKTGKKPPLPPKQGFGAPRC